MISLSLVSIVRPANVEKKIVTLARLSFFWLALKLLVI